MAVDTHSTRNNTELREALRSAAGPLSYKTVWWMCGLTGHGLTITADTLSRFGDKRISKINDADAARLSSFLFETETGRLIRRDAPGPAGIFDELITSLSGGARSKNARDITGSFYIVHGSYMRRAHYVVRAMIIEEKADGLLCVEDYLRDTVGIDENQSLVHRAYGVVTFDATKPTFLLRRNDNSLGSNLIVSDKVSPPTGRIDRIIGQKLGMTSEHMHFSRAVLIARTPKPMTASEMFPETGIFPRSALQPEMEKLLETLSGHQPQQVFADPILEF